MRYRLCTGLDFVIDTQSMGIDHVGVAALSCLTLVLKTCGALLSQVRVWIEHNEPSSPVSVLLKQAERMWGKRFSEVAGEIPPELLQAWDRD